MGIKITRHITPKDLKEMNRKAWRKTAADLKDLIFQRSQEILATFSFDGDLLGSGFVRAQEQNNGFVKLFVGYNAPHARPVEFGSVPHWAPPFPIYDWARRKLGKSGPPMSPADSDRLFGLAFGGLKPRNAAERAFIGIYRKIGTRGTEPHPYFRPAVELARPVMPRLYTKNLAKEMT